MAASAETTLLHWAKLAGPLRCPPRLSFASKFAGLIARSRTLRGIEFRELGEIANQSRERMTPLGEPLEYDLGVNRWLAGAREEAYSDWLAWLFAKMSAEELAHVLSLPELLNLGVVASGDRIRADREVWVEHGHQGHSGRVDILLLLNDCAVVGIEVKLGSAREADTPKQKGYIIAIEDDPKFYNCRKSYVLLVTDASEEEVCGFRVRTYSKLCRNLRRLAVKWMGPQQINPQHLFISAVMLTVVAAIEINVLRLSLQKASFTSATLTHLTTFLGRTDYE